MNPERLIALYVEEYCLYFGETAELPEITGISDNIVSIHVRDTSLKDICIFRYCFFFVIFVFL